MSGPDDLALVRQALETALGRERATGTLFVALDASPTGVPRTRDDWRAFLDGSLRDALAARADVDVDAVVAQVRDALGEPDDTEVAVDVDVDADSGEPSETLFMPTSANKPVPVLTVAASDALAQRLLTVLGHDRVKPTWVADEATLRKATFAAVPLLVLVDGADLPAIDAAGLAAALRAMPDTVVSVLWAADLPSARDLANALGNAGATITSLSKREGVEPLLDLILSRLS